MSSAYRIALYTNDGVYRYDITRFFSLAITKSENAPGALTMTVPATYAIGDFAKDARLIIYRSVDGTPFRPLFDTLFLIRETTITVDTSGVIITVKAFDLLSLLSRRIVYASAGSSGATKTARVDQVIKQFVSENLRGLPITVQIYATTSNQNPTITKSAAQQNVLTTIQSCAQMSAQLGSYYLFDVLMDSSSIFEFRGWFDHRGRDVRENRLGAFVVDFASKTLTDAKITTSYVNEINYVYEGGPGTGASRTIVIVQDASSIAAGMQGGAVEAFNDGSSMTIASSLTSDAQSFLREKRGRTIFTGHMRQTPTLRFGIEYSFGDVVTAHVLGLSFDCRISSVALKLDGTSEDISATLQSIQPITGGRTS